MSPSMGRNHPPGQLVNLDMEKKPFCWFERENKYCSSQHQESMWQGLQRICGSIAIASLCGKVYRQSKEGPMWQQRRPDITRAPVQLSREGGARQKGYAMCRPGPAD